MGNQIVWHDRFNIGVDVIDKEHRKLFSILNRLFMNQQDDKSQWVCQEGIKYFKDHAMKHFTEEEAYMASINYQGFETHRRLHDNFRKKTLPELERELNRTRYSQDAISHFLGVCAGWLIAHTLTEDRAITGKIMSKWEDLLPEEEQEAMKQTIIWIFQDLFQKKARVVSECYGGEKFGRGIYYRLLYAGKKGEKWEIILVFEEKLIMNTVGDMIDTESDNVNVMIMNAVRYIARQFMERVREHFPSVGLYEMKEETLMTYDQFKRTFERENPQISLLFNTGGAGYFAFCVIAPHLVDQEGGTAINAENAMVQIKKYLKNDKENIKKKILVVDDSEIVRHAMRQLLENDYEIVLAGSGLSAIHSLAVNRPDLILLDYEMPVCNGSQILEMIRAEKEFADIPVIFLTGRSDRESVQKVISLKPAGYLIKTLKPAEIKKGIDEFFKN